MRGAGDDTVASAGLLYRYRASELLSVGALAEYAGGSLEHWVIGIPFVLHVGEGWQLMGMPGVEIHSGHEKFLFRAGVGYEFEMPGGHSITPELAVDFVDGETSLVLGVAIGWRF